ncbi:type IV pilus twitching motility protein PilT [Clostridium vitabionis]|uniref:type IV pilus twitching motility protein PilT n=1 Tax=Clostridium vitabionis TaxID=2784388 RepID=UPI001A9B3076|nr:PilT/PilU family type 4a pilus ATPase [Clostridium vitabionis]
MTEISLEDLVALAAGKGASDIHLIYGLPPKCRVNGELTDLAPGILGDDACRSLAGQAAGGRLEELDHIGEIDLARTISGARCRINLFHQQGHLSMALRILSDHIPDLEELGVPPAVLEFPGYRKGIILVTGETGSGKSTTLAAILDRINHTRRGHIITMEDPVEYIYKPDKCIVNQREIGTDTRDYASAMRAVLREDPDIILIGEMRDPETMLTAMTAAETGHLVFATLHTSSAVDSVDRIVSSFDANRRDQIRMELSMTLRAVLSQQLLPRADRKGRALACECMISTAAIRNLIREGKTPQMSSIMLANASEGSITMDNCLARLVREGTVTRETALEAANDQEFLKKRLSTYG